MCENELSALNMLARKTRSGAFGESPCTTRFTGRLAKSAHTERAWDILSVLLRCLHNLETLHIGIKGKRDYLGNESDDEDLQVNQISSDSNASFWKVVMRMVQDHTIKPEQCPLLRLTTFHMQDMHLDESTIFLIVPCLKRAFFKGVDVQEGEHGFAWRKTKNGDPIKSKVNVVVTSGGNWQARYHAKEIMHNVEAPAVLIHSLADMYDDKFYKDYHYTLSLVSVMATDSCPTSSTGCHCK